MKNLNIKSAEAHELALKLSQKTGESMTAAVIRALKSQLRRLDDMKDREARLDAIVARTAPILADGPGSADIDALLYDELGLPK